MSSFCRNPWFPAGLAFLIGLVLRIFFIVATPIAGDSIPGTLSSYNDEIAHANYTHTLLTTHSLPVQIEPIDNTGALQRGRFENYQPPLYYILHAAVVSIFPGDSISRIVFSGRVLSLFLGLLCFPVFILIAKAIELTSLETAAGTVFLSLSGILIRFQSTCTNDTLFWLILGLIYLSVLKLSRSAFSIRHWLFFALLAAIALYIKLSALLLLPLPLWIIYQQKQNREFVVWGLSIVIICVLTLPVWLRNLNEFGGLLPLQAGFGLPDWRLPDLDSFLYMWRSLVFPWSEFWQGVFGLILISLPPAFIAVRFWKKRTEWSGPYAILSFGFLIVLAAFLWLNLRYDQAESRYLFAAWPLITVFAAKSANKTSAIWLLTLALLLPHLLFLV